MEIVLFSIEVCSYLTNQAQRSCYVVDCFPLLRRPLRVPERPLGMSRLNLEIMLTEHPIYMFNATHSLIISSLSSHIIMKGVSLDTVRASNATLKALGPATVAVFVGGTSGIGEAILKATIRATIAPRVYIVGRNRNSGDRIIRECRAMNDSSKIEFLKADVSELANVDRVCNNIVQRERTLNLLVLTAGILSIDGRNGIISFNQHYTR